MNWGSAGAPNPLSMKHLDLSPARWIWYPSGRILPSTMVLFRRALKLSERPLRATGWLLADSRYLLKVNGERVQWGPAPSDPRWPEADPLDLTTLLEAGDNVLAVQVLYYGHGDGTWPIGKPGLLFKLELEFADGRMETVVSDGSWQAHLARSWKPGQYKRWYLRAFQEELDARLYPHGWEERDFSTGTEWREAMEIVGRADQPPICHELPDSLMGVRVVEPGKTGIFPRCIPQMDESLVPVAALAESKWISWKLPVAEYFESLTPDAFEVDEAEAAEVLSASTWRVGARDGRSPVLTFMLPEQLVGWPYFTIEAPAGTVVELMVQQSHEVGGPALLNTCYHSWSRFTCCEGVNRFETFDYECLKWMQLHVHGDSYEGGIKISSVGVRRRMFPWAQTPAIECSDAMIQRVLEASLNTLNNSCLEIAVDCMGRERQQYSGDCGHQLQALYPAFGESRVAARYLRTYSQGMTVDGYFMDCWPAYDRLARIMERELGLFHLGPILDHGVQFLFDSHHYFLQTGDRELIREIFPRLARFFQYLQSIRGADGLLFVEDKDLGIPCVWIDYDAFRGRSQKHKTCAFNLYAAGMCKVAFAPLCEAMGETRLANEAMALGAALHERCVDLFWDKEVSYFVENKPWLEQEGTRRTSDRTLAMSVLFEQCPEGAAEAAVRMLLECPKEMGFSYPANAIWRLRALAAAGRIDAYLDDVRRRWGAMPSVHENNALQEQWVAKYDSASQWSHCAVSPLIVWYQGVAGLEPLEPGFARYRIRPQLGDMEKVQFRAWTPLGPIDFGATGRLGDRLLSLELPPGGEGELVLDERETVDLPILGKSEMMKLTTYRLRGRASVKLKLQYA